MDNLIDISYLAVSGKLNFEQLFIASNVLLRNRPEVYVLHGAKRAFVVNSGSGGINGHAHKLQQVFEKDLLEGCAVGGAEVYFKCLSEWMHDHPDENQIYYICAAAGGGGEEEYAIYDYKTRSKVTHNGFGAGHYHSLSIAMVIETMRALSKKRREIKK